MAAQAQANSSGANSAPTGRPTLAVAAPSRLMASGRAEVQPRLSNGMATQSLLDEPMLELELALAHFERLRPFVEVVTEAASSAGGEFLFDLPASGLLPDCSRLAAVRLPSGTGAVTVLACLDLDGETIRVEAPDERTRHLSEFADAFVDVLQRF